MAKCYQPRLIDLKRDKDTVYRLRVRDEAGMVIVDDVVEIRVTNGTITDDGYGVVSIDTGAGGGAGSGGGSGELLYWITGQLIAGVQPMTVHNRVRVDDPDNPGTLIGVTLNINEVFVDVSEAPTGGAVTFSVAGATVSCAAGSHVSNAANVTYPLAYLATINVTLGVPEGVFASNALVHLPYTY